MKKRWLISLFLVIASLFIMLGLTACNKTSYNIDFMVDNAVYATVETQGDATVQMPSAPSKEGYTFDGWYWDNGTWNEPFTENSLLETPLTSNATVYAKFTEIHSHTYETTVIPPTCEEDGYTVYKCSCGDEYTGDAVTATGHTFTKKVLDDTYLVTIATCETPETYYYSCACGAKGEDTFTVGSAKGHKFVNYVSDENATTEADGTKTAHCENSGCTKTDTITDEGSKLPPVHTHAYETVVTHPTCTERGYTTHTCSCGDSYIDNYENALSHKFENYISDNNATMEEDGTKTAKCENAGCNETKTITDEGSRIPADYSLGMLYKYNEDDETYTVIGIGTCTDTTVIIPSIYKGKTVTSIDEQAFNGATMQSVVIPNTITYIGEFVFSHCDNLMSVTIPSSVTAIGEYAFYDCSKLTSVTIADNVKTIGAWAFAFCPIETANIPVIAVENITNSQIKTVVITSGDAIGEYAFTNCDNLTSVTFPSSMKSIGNHAFSDCDRLQTILIPSSVKTIGDYAFSSCRSLENINIPEGVTTIGVQVLSGCSSLKNITIPNTVESIGDDAFSSCTALTSIVIPDSVVTIGNSAFYGCRNLKNVTISTGVTSIGSLAFYDCPMEFVSAPTLFIPALDQVATRDTLKTLIITGGDTIENGAFEYHNSLTSVSFAASIKSIGDLAFNGCEKLTSIEFANGNSLEYIGENAFAWCKGLSTVALGEGTQPLIIGTYAFANCDLTSITLSSNVAAIGYKALKDCACINVTAGNAVYSSIDGNLYSNNGTVLVQYATAKTETTFVIPASVRTIESYAFMNSKNLASITIPSNVTSIGVSAFEYCDRLTSITFDNTIGWYCTMTAGAASGRDVTVTDGHQNANLLKGTYVEYYWYTAFTGHNYASVVTPPTCTEQGFTTYTCADCGDSYVSDYVAATGHTAGTAVVEDTIDATCTADGSYNSNVYCTVCGDKVSGTQYAIPALGHDEVTHDAQAADCTHVGWDAYVTCSRCDYTTYQEIEATGHDFGAWYETIAPSENAPGEERRDCTQCNHYETREVAELGHQHQHTAHVTAPTCTAQGYTTYTCGCGDNYVTDYVAATGHSEGSAVIEDTVDSTCTTTGSYNSNVYCTVCGSKVSGTAHTIPALGHDEINHTAKAATCTDDGWNAYVSCSRCDYTTYSEIPATGHTEGAWIVDSAATCTANGSKHQICGTCGVTINTQTISATGHSFGGWVVINAATCTQEGTEQKTCACGVTETRSIAAGHKYEGHVCSVCGDVLYSEGLTFSAFRNGYAVAGVGTCTDTTIVIPNEYNGLPVIAIKENAFGSNQKIQEVIVPDSVLIIEKGAFSYSKKISHIDLGTGVVEIGMSFAGCDSLTNITIPASVEAIDNLAFYLAKNLENILVDNGNSVYSSVDGILYNKAKTEVVCCPANNSMEHLTLPSTVITISSYAFVDCVNLKTVTMSNNVTTIGGSAFSDCRNLESVVMSNNITKIENWAFENCTSLQSCVIPNGVTMLYSYVFQDCTSLEWVYISKNVTRAGSDPFDGCDGLKTIYFGGTEEQWNSITYTSTAPTYLGINFVFEYDASCNHETVVDAARAPTCTVVGLTEGSHCGVCGTVLVKQEEIATIDHIEELVQAVLPTCTSVGYTQGTQCSMCKKSIVAPVEIPMTAHTEEVIPAVDPTCYSFGYTAGKKCSVCQTVTVTPQNIGFADHTTEDVDAVEATCSSSGATAGKKCTVCQAIVEGCVYVAPLPHDYIDGVCDDCGARYYSSGFTFQKYASWQNASTGVTINNAAIITGYKGTDTEVYIPKFDGIYTIIGIDFNAFQNNTKITKVVIPDTVRFINGNAFRGCSKLESVNIPELVTTLSGYAMFMDCTSLKSIVIPNSVKELGQSIFDGCTSLESVVLSNQIKKIPLQAFLDCRSLKEVTLPATVTSIDGYGFGNCSSLSKIEILGNLKSIDYSAFSGCSSLTEFNIQPTVTYIGSGAFSSCSNLERIVIPSSVTTMSYGVFRSCDKITIYCEVEYAPDGWREDWNDDNCPVVWGCYYAGNNITADGFKWHINDSDTVTIDDFVYVIDGTAIGTQLNIPSEISGIAVTEIADYAFDSYALCRNIDTVVIPRSVQAIGAYAFIGFDAIKSISVPNTLTSVGKAAFNVPIEKVVFNGTAADWLQLAEIVSEYNEKLITASVYTSGGEQLAFDDVKYLKYQLNDDGLSYTIAGVGVFSGSVLNIPSSYNGKPVTAIGDNAFYGCSNIKEITIPDSVTDIKRFAFGYCDGVEKVTFTSNSNLVTIGDCAFSGCSALKTFAVPAKVTAIGDEAFCNCGNLNEFSFASDAKIQSIGQYCFTDCNGLMSITIPKTVTSIGEYAFWYCYKLIEVYNLSSLSIVKGSTANGYAGYYALHIYTSANTASKITTTNDGYVSYYDSASGKYYLMGYRGNSKNLVLPDKINNNKYAIYTYAFANSNIESVYVPAGVTAVGGSAFRYCEKLASVTFENGFTGTIGDAAFMECNSLKTFTIPDGIKEVDSYIFRCHSLETIYVPHSVTKLDMYAFAYNENLKSIHFAGTKAEWNAIEKWRDWDLDTGNYTVYCTDGTI